MKKEKFIFFNVLFILSLVCFCIALVYFFGNPLQNPSSFIFAICLYFQLVFGIYAILWSAKSSHKAYQLFLGLIFSFWSLTALISYYFFPQIISISWPIYGVESGIALLISGFYKYRKLKFGFFFFAICLIVICLWYFLFTFQIIKLPFLMVAKITTPIFFFLIALSLTLFFIFQKKHKSFMIKDDDQGIFSDEEISLEDDNDFDN